MTTRRQKSLEAILQAGHHNYPKQQIIDTCFNISLSVSRDPFPLLIRVFITFRIKKKIRKCLNSAEFYVVPFRSMFTLKERYLWGVMKIFWN